MNLSIHSGLTIAGQTLRALRRYPDRIAFSSEMGTLRYAAATDLIGRIQSVFARGGLKRGERVALLSENSAESWCTAVAAQGLGLSVTWLHPKGSLADHSFQVDDSESAAIVISAATHAERGRDLACCQHLDGRFQNWVSLPNDVVQRRCSHSRSANSNRYCS